MIRPFVLWLASFTRTARGRTLGLRGAASAWASATVEGSLLSSLGWGFGRGLPSRWATSMSSSQIGGRSIRWSLQSFINFCSRVPWPCSGRPKIRMDPLRPCCSISSFLSSSSVTRSSSFLIVSSRSAIWRRSAAFVSFNCRRATPLVGLWRMGRFSEAAAWHSLAGKPARLQEWNLHHHCHRYHLYQPYWMSEVYHSNLTCHSITIQSRLYWAELKLE